MITPVFDPALTAHQKAYCEELARTGAVVSSAHAIGWSKVTLAKEKKDSKLFRDSIKEATIIAAERVLAELNDRAYNGESLPAISQGMPVYKRDPRNGEIELDDDFEPIVLTYRKHDKAYLFKLMDALMPEMRQGGVNFNINQNDEDEEKAKDRSGIRVQFIMPDGRTEEHYERIERGETEGS